MGRVTLEEQKILSLLNRAKMKKVILTKIAVLLLMATSVAQVDKFDIATYTPPQGWQQLDSNGKRGFFDYKSDGNSTRFCQILLYPSRKSTGNAQKDFDDEWSSRITKVTGYSKKPAAQTRRSPEGWTVVTGAANIPSQGQTYTCILTCYSGFGKEMSVLVNVAGQEYLSPVDEFFKSFALDKSAGSPGNRPGGISAPLDSLTAYIYRTPNGWNATRYPDGVVLSSPVSNTGEKCNITLWPIRTSSGNLQTDAANLFGLVFKDFELRTGSTPNSIIRGISPQGWEYFIIKNAIVLRGGDYQTMFGFAFVAKLGNQVARISGISKDPLVSSCFGLQLSDVWPQFFYSLNFKNWQPAAQPQIGNRLAGIWMAVTGSAGDRFAFASNGRFAGAAASQRYVRLSSTELLRVTDAYFGDGSYVISGNGISLIHDSEKNNPERALFRIEQESTNGGATWKDKLFLLRKSVVDGSEYEVAYDKQ